MFDDLRCEMPLPDGKKAIPFQTKDLDCQLYQFTIRADGRLIKSDGACPDDDLLVGENVLETYTGTINFYGYEGDPNKVDFAKVWREYRATVVDGRVTKLEVIKRDD